MLPGMLACLFSGFYICLLPASGMAVFWLTPTASRHAAQYGPTLAEQLLDNPNDINMKGLLIGNPGINSGAARGRVICRGPVIVADRASLRCRMITHCCHSPPSINSTLS